MNILRGVTLNRAGMATVIGLTSLLTGCYVVPIDYGRGAGNPPSGHTSVHLPVPPVGPITFTARLYPANEAAASYGTVGAVVTNDLNGKGTFTTVINGESFAGEATRTQGTNRAGIANGTGNRGSYISCRYQMNSTTAGVGTCKLSNAAEFSMHIGN
jgi:hypothetical protein